jgi:hypothetical protein
MFMPTYENCYEILADVRRGINEYASGYMSAADTTCPHSNGYIVKCINRAQRYIYNVLLRRLPGEFLQSTSLTGVSSVFTLPWDFGKLRYFKDDKGYQVYRLDHEDRKISGQTGSDRTYYRKGNTLVLDKDGVTDTYTLEYYRKPRDLDQGSASAGAATSMTLATTAKAIADYYNGMGIEINTGTTFTDTITDYTAARVCTITNTGVAATFYGIISDLPEMFHLFIAPKATHIIKAESPVMQEKPTKDSMSQWDNELLEAMRSYVGSDLDRDVEDLFLDYEPGFDVYTGIIATE